MSKEQNDSVRFIGNVKERQFNGKNGPFTRLMIEISNPTPLNKDGTENPYHKGVLVWFDAETKKQYVVKQITLSKVSEAQAKYGAVNSLKLDLSNTYEVEELS
jgi:hypothetical protein